MASFKVGQTVELNDGRVGIIRFIGETSFSSGRWVGVEFDSPSGKNDGSVQGQRYFNCKPGHGMFLRTTGIARILHSSLSTSTSSSSSPSGLSGTAAALKARTHARLGSCPNISSPGSGKSSSTARPISGSDTTQAHRPATSVSGFVGGNTGSHSHRFSHSPTKVSSKSSSLRGTGVSAGASSNLSSLQSGPSKVSRLSRPLSISSLSPSKSDNTLPDKQECIDSPSQDESSGQSPSKLLRPLSYSIPQLQSATIHQLPTASPKLTSTESSNGLVQQGITSKVMDDLQIKVRLLEKKRMEDREKIRTLDATQKENTRLTSIIQKLQTKYQPLQQEVIGLREKNKEWELKYTEAQNSVTENESILEMATLDREMAEEQVDVFKAELETVKHKNEELQLENEILKEEIQELSKDMSPEERASKGWLQMERESEMLREALIRLRDISQEQEALLTKQIRDLEKDVQEMPSLRNEAEVAKTKLLEKEELVADLKQQLEAALSAEDIIEQITERNHILTERVEELEKTVEDLQNLQDLNDEIEFNHGENEKQLQELISYKDTVINENGRKLKQQEELIADLHYTIQRFRELVSTLQADLEEMRTSKRITESEAHELDNKSRAIMDLNRKLQLTVSNTRAQTIEMELRRIEAEEAMEHLAILRNFLPESLESEGNSVLTLFWFKRVSAKVRLLEKFTHNTVSSGNEGSGRANQIFFAWEVLEQLKLIECLCDKLGQSIACASLEEFSGYKDVLFELEAVERGIMEYLEMAKTEELVECDMMEGLKRCTAVIEHVAENMHGRGAEHWTEVSLFNVKVCQRYVESSVSVLSVIQSELKTVWQEGTNDTTETQEMERYVGCIDEVISIGRNSQTVGWKLLKLIEEAGKRNRAPKMEIFEEGLGENRRNGEELARLVRNLGLGILNAVHDEQGEYKVTRKEVLGCVKGRLEGEDWACLGKRAREIFDEVNKVYELASEATSWEEFERTTPPWILRAKEMRMQHVAEVELNDEVNKLRDELQERKKQVKLGETSINEAGHRIELLERRLKEAIVKKQECTELERQTKCMKEQMEELTRVLEERTHAVTTMGQESEHWKGEANKFKAIVDSKRALTQGGDGDRNGNGDDGRVRRHGEAASLRGEIRALQAANRFLRRQNLQDTVPLRRQQQRGEEEQLQKPYWLARSIVRTKRGKGDEKGQDEVKVRTARLLKRITGLPEQGSLVEFCGGEETENELRRNLWKPRQATLEYQLLKQESLIWDIWQTCGGGDGDFMGDVGVAIPVL